MHSCCNWQLVNGPLLEPPPLLGPPPLTNGAGITAKPRVKRKLAKKLFNLILDTLCFVTNYYLIFQIVVDVAFGNPPT
jgi:hypothetical protein